MIMATKHLVRPVWLFVVVAVVIYLLETGVM